MYRVFILTGRQSEDGALREAVEFEGIAYELGIEGDLDRLGNGDLGPSRPDAVLLDLDSLDEERGKDAAARCKRLGLPLIAVVSAERASGYDLARKSPDDFILQPLRPGELPLRVGQAVAKTSGSPKNHLLKVGDLLIDTERYETRVAGRKVVLTFKEYQMLLLLASNPGRVYTRDALLSQVWGYDYFGGTRTVDVHVRRLRSKIEDAGHSFIETIWNVGYRFKGPS